MATDIYIYIYVCIFYHSGHTERAYENIFKTFNIMKMKMMMVMGMVLPWTS